MRNGRATTQARSEAFVEEIDDLQYETGEGPCLESIKTGDMYYVNCTPDEDRWKEFCDLAAHHGVGSVLSFPLRAQVHALGALNLYSMEVDGFSEGDKDMAKIFAAQASIAVANAQLYDDSQMLVDNLYDAMASRGVIEQAKGIIIERENCSPEEAFETLKKASQDTNVKLRDIAARLVEAAQARRT
jgi:GAF domain-containing protein